MNGFIPVLLAVLLAEIGERALALSEARERRTLAWPVLALIGIAAAGGVVARGSMPGNAPTLLIGVALAFAGATQLRAPRPQATFASFWRGGTLFLVFAMAARFGSVAVVAGVLAGLFAAILITRAAVEAAWNLASLRRASAILLILAGSASAIGALRLI